MKIIIYTVTNCEFSKQEKAYLSAHNLSFEEKNLEANRNFLTEMLGLSNNFAGTPVTKIEKDDGQVVILKGFTQTEFDQALALTSAAPVSTEQQQMQKSDISQPIIEKTPEPQTAVPTPITAPPAPVTPEPQIPNQPLVTNINPVNPPLSEPTIPQAAIPTQPTIESPTIEQVPPVIPESPVVSPVQQISQPNPLNPILDNLATKSNEEGAPPAAQAPQAPVVPPTAVPPAAPGNLPNIPDFNG